MFKSKKFKNSIPFPQWRLSTLAKEFSVAARIVQKLFERIDHSGSR